MSWRIVLLVFLLSFLFYPLALKAAQPGDHDGTLIFHGVRKFRVHVPAFTVPEKGRSAIFALHGGGGDIASLQTTSLLDQAADKFGFIVVYPQGTGKRKLGKEYGTWNAGKCCGYALENNVNDVAFFSRLIDVIVADYGVNPKRVYFTGHSNGGMMTYRLACELSNKIAAIAPVGAQNAMAECRPARPVPTLHAHGTLDPCTPFAGGTCGGCFTTFLKGLGIHLESATWACDSVPASIDKWRAIHKDVTLVSIPHMGHTWPGGLWGSVCQRPGSYLCKQWQKTVGPRVDYPFNEQMWRFFDSHPMR